MSAVLKASLARAPGPHADRGRGAAWTLHAGADLILGAPPAEPGLQAPVTADAASLFAPRGVELGGRDGPLLVADTGHHRVLVWRDPPGEDGAPADLVLGQPDFAAEARNAGGEPSALSLNAPTGLACADGVLAVADAWNHRVLLWFGPPGPGRAADLVLGQADFAGGLPNRGEAAPRADTLHWCYGVLIQDGRLFVADTGNRRVLAWDRLPTRNGQAADLVLGQPDFERRDENAGRAPGPVGMRWPHALAAAPDGALFVADAGDNRVMGWRALPGRNGAPCDLVLGQADMAGVDHNRGQYRPTAASLNMPYGLAMSDGALVVADTANSRLLAYGPETLATGAAATRLAGQACFDERGDNRWRAPGRDTLCWPYGLAARGGALAAADSGNNRVLVWRSVGSGSRA